MVWGGKGWGFTVEKKNEQQRNLEISCPYAPGLQTRADWSQQFS